MTERSQMQFDCGESDEEQGKRLKLWHRFFAIIPRQVGEHDCRWMETIERRLVAQYARSCGDSYDIWEYRALR
jgi:hypothetical protein